MIKEQFFPTTIYGQDTQLDNNFLANKIIEWSKQKHQFYHNMCPLCRKSEITDTDIRFSEGGNAKYSY